MATLYPNNDISKLKDELKILNDNNSNYIIIRLADEIFYILEKKLCFTRFYDHTFMCKKGKQGMFVCRLSMTFRVNEEIT